MSRPGHLSEAAISAPVPVLAPGAIPSAPVQKAAPAPLLSRGGHDDLDGVIAVMERAFAPCFGEGWSRSQCAGILPLAGVHLDLARPAADAAPHGFALWRVIADEAELLLLAVAPEAQHQGVGRALLDRFVAEAAAAGANHLHLEVRDSNPARRFYEAAGFTEAGRRPAYYHGRDGSAHDALTLVRKITT